MTDARLQRVVLALREVGADWAVLTGADTVAYALGHAPPIEAGASPFAAGSAVGLIGRDGSAGLLASRMESATPRDGVLTEYDAYADNQSEPPLTAYLEGLRALCRRLGVAGRLAVEAATHPVALDAALPEGARADITKPLRRVRAEKTPEEHAALLACAELAAVGQRHLCAVLREGVSELALFGALRTAMEEAAGERLAIGGDLLSGRARTAAIGGWPGPRRITRGDAVIADLGPRFRGYWGDSCGTVVLGDATAEQAALFAAARTALDHALEILRPGLSACDLHRAVQGVVRRHGFDYPHHTGHSIGTAVHEHPRIAEGEDFVLRAGMVLMIEPGAYHPDIGGVRTEWMLRITDTGCVPMAPFPHVLSV